MASKKFVVFALGSERYAVSIDQVQSIEYMKPVTRVPHTPDYVKGVFNLRGIIMAVLDLRVMFNMPAQEATKDSRILIVSDGETEVGWIVDSANSVAEIEDSAILPPGDEADESISGIIPADNHVIGILNLPALMRKRAG